MQIQRQAVGQQGICEARGKTILDLCTDVTSVDVESLEDSAMATVEARVGRLCVGSTRRSTFKAQHSLLHIVTLDPPMLFKAQKVATSVSNRLARQSLHRSSEILGKLASRMGTAHNTREKVIGTSFAVDAACAVLKRHGMACEAKSLNGVWKEAIHDAEYGPPRATTVTKPVQHFVSHKADYSNTHSVLATATIRLESPPQSRGARPPVNASISQAAAAKGCLKGAAPKVDRNNRAKGTNLHRNVGQGSRCLTAVGLP